MLNMQTYGSNKMTSSFLRTGTFILGALTLSACSYIEPLTMMPAAYTYHEDTYKSQPGVDAKDIGYDYSAPENEKIMAIWRVVAEDLLNQFEEETGLFPQPVFLSRIEDENAFNASLDFSLREELRLRGYTLEQSAGDHIYMRYDVFPVGQDINMSLVPDERKEDPVMTTGKVLVDVNFALTVYDSSNQQILGPIASTYTVPRYGYKPRNDSLFTKPVYGSAR